MTPAPAYRPLLGIGLVALATANFSVLDTTAKAVSATLPLLMVLWARYAVQAVVTAAVALPWRGTAVLRTRHLPFHLLRAVLLLVCSLLGLASLRHIDVAEFTAIVMLSPLAVTLLAGLVLKEEVSVLRWALVAGGFLGTLVIIQPGGEAFTWAMLLPVALVATNAWFQVLTIRLARTEDPVTMHLYGGLFGAGLATIALPVAWSMVREPWLLAGLAALGVLGAIGHFLLILAYRNAPAATLTPYLYLQIAFAMLAGWLAFGHVPDGWSMVGMGLIALCGGAGAWLTVQETRTPQPAKAAA